MSNETEEMITSIPFEEIVPGATVRVVVKDDVQYLSTRDLIMHLCHKDNNHAAEVWRRLPENTKEELNAFCSQHQFPAGKSKQPVITFLGALKLIMFLPGEAAKNHRSAMTDILRRYFAGDPSLLDEVNANAVSKSPVAQMARASIAAEGGNQIDDSRKRKREELELMKLETEIKCMERKSQVDLWNGQIAVVAQYKSLCTDTDMDERAKIMFKDAILNAVIVGTGQAITNGDSDAARPVSLSQVAKRLGMTLTIDDMRKVGGIVSKLYMDRHGEAPKKHTQLVDGRATQVNSYFAPDEDLLEEGLRTYSEAEERRKSAAAQPRQRASDLYLRRA